MGWGGERPVVSVVGGSSRGSRAYWVNVGPDGWPGLVLLLSQGESSCPCCWLPGTWCGRACGWRAWASRPGTGEVDGECGPGSESARRGCLPLGSPWALSLLCQSRSSSAACSFLPSPTARGGCRAPWDQQVPKGLGGPARATVMTTQASRHPACAHGSHSERAASCLGVEQGADSSFP